MIKKKNRYYLSVINKIEKIRSKNNTNWMNILRIAFKNHQVKLQRLWLKFILRIKTSLNLQKTYKIKNS